MSIENYEVFTLDDLEDTDCSSIVNDDVEDLTVEDTVGHDSVLRFTEMAEQVSLDDFAQIETFGDENIEFSTELELSEKLDTPIEDEEPDNKSNTSILSAVDVESCVEDSDNISEITDGEADRNDTQDVVFRQGMTIVEFLRENPTIRSKIELCKYFTTENVNRAIHNGAIMCMHDKICL